MHQPSINNQFGINNQLVYFVHRERNSNQVKKKKDLESVIPTQPKVQKYQDSDYYLDSISEFVTNQSLTPEQIAKSQTKTIIEEINVLSSKYEIKNFEEIKNFLLKNHFLISFLEEIPNKIYQYFGSDQKISLKISQEPDFPQSSELCIYILTKLPANESFSILDKFDEDWWLGNIDRAGCKLNISLKYI